MSTDATGLETIKIHLDSMLFTPNAKWTDMDISNMYLNKPLDRYEYMHSPNSTFLPDIIAHYNLISKAAGDGFIYIEIRWAMYGLK